MVYHHHRPLHAMYGDNYRYGTSLYSSHGMGDVEKSYRNTLAKTHVRSDRGDLGLYTFAGSHLHGGVAAANASSSTRSTMSRSKSHDLYAPLSFGYGRSYYDHLRTTPDSHSYTYYDHLRATTPEPKTKTTTKMSSYSLHDESDYLKKTTSDYDSSSDVKKTITTTSERWVPLTTYIYNTPYHTYYYSSSPYTSRTYRTTDDLYSYNYVDDFKRDSSYSTKSKNIEALDLSIKSSKQETFDYNLWSSKCSEIKSQLDQVNQWVSDAESRIKTDIVGARSKMQAELSDIALVVEDTTKYNEELQRVIKRQARQITDLNSQYDDINRHFVDVSDTLEKTRIRCQTLGGELASVQSGIELAMKRR